MEAFHQPGVRGQPEARKERGPSSLPLLVIYSSDLEEKCLGFWYRSIRGELALDCFASN